MLIDIPLYRPPSFHIFSHPGRHRIISGVTIKDSPASF